MLVQETVPFVALAPTPAGVLGEIKGFYDCTTGTYVPWQEKRGNPTLAIRYMDGPENNALYGLMTYREKNELPAFYFMLGFGLTQAKANAWVFYQILRQYVSAVTDHRTENVCGFLCYRVTLEKASGSYNQDVLILASEVRGKDFLIILDDLLSNIADEMAQAIVHEQGVAKSHLIETVKQLIPNKSENARID